MNKHFLFLVSVPFSIYAQLFNPGNLVNSNEIGNDLLLFVPDSVVQILRNPARAAAYDGGFIYISKFNGSSRNYTTIPSWTPANYRVYRAYSNLFQKPVLFSDTDNDFINASAINLAYMFGESKNKWLLKIVSLDNVYDSEYFEHDTDKDLDNFRRDVRESSNNSVSKFHNISINKIIHFDNFDFSVGVSAGKGENTYLYDYERLYNSENVNDTYANFHNDQSINNTKGDIDNLFFGIELDLSDGDWDIISSLFYIESDFRDDFENSFSYRQSTYELSISNIIYSRIDGENQRSKNHINAKSYYGEIYIKKSLEFINQHMDLFINANGFNSFDDQKLKYDLYATNYLYDSSIDTLYVTDSEGSNTFHDNSQTYNLRSGFVFSNNIDNLYFLSGLLASFSYSDGKRKSLNFAGNEFLIGNVSFKEYSYMLEVPLYLNYTPASWLDIYAGYHIAYILRDFTYANEIDDGYRGRGEDNKQENFANYDKTYLGINLKHSSGFRAQIGFNGTFTSYRNWNLSLGYEF